MSHLPVIIGFGGINPAGRTSFHHAYRRLILDKVTQDDAEQTLTGLATLMNLASYTPDSGQFHTTDGSALSAAETAARFRQQIIDNTLIRRIHPDWFDVHNMTSNQQAKINGANDEPLKFTLRRRQLPNKLPNSWQIKDLGLGMVEVTTTDSIDLIFNDSKVAQVQTAGQLPTGFRPGDLYQSRNHPRSLQMTVFGASDALQSTGIPWEQIRAKISPDEVGVYAGNSSGQLDDYGFGGLIKNPHIGKRTTSKLMPLGYGQMPGDFINAYLLGNVGSTGTSIGACATFLYNLRNAVDDIKSGRRKLVLVGGSDASILPEVIEGFRSMGALAEDKDLMALDNVEQLTEDSYRKACRPFANNCGFTMGESAQFTILCADDLALELGADIHGAVPDVFVNADGYKKSISAPGIGNYVTLGKAASLVRSMLGEESLKERSFVQAHGTSTPQNRVTESHVINETAKAFGINNWLISAVKCYLGHSQGTAGGDQLSLSLGTWKYGYVPGIVTMDQVASDVHQSNIRLEQQHTEVGTEGMDSVLLNSKGFGGNNASAVMLAPHIVQRLLERKHGSEAMRSYLQRAENTRACAADYDRQATLGLSRPTYLFGQNVLAGEDLSISDESIRLPGYELPISLDVDNPFDDMSD